MFLYISFSFLIIEKSSTYISLDEDNPIFLQNKAIFYRTLCKEPLCQTYISAIIIKKLLFVWC